MSHAGDLSTPLSSNIQKGLREARGITRFYSHQAAAINAVAAGKHVIVSTATASGKSVIYQVGSLVPLPRTLYEVFSRRYPCFDISSKSTKQLPSISIPPRSELRCLFDSDLIFPFRHLHKINVLLWTNCCGSVLT